LEGKIMAEITAEKEKVKKVPEKGALDTETKTAQDLTDQDVEKALEVFKKKINRQSGISLLVCAHCGMCNDACHYYLGLQDPKMVPAYKADQLRRVYKRKLDPFNKIFPGAILDGKTDIKWLEKLYDVCWGSCTMCRRCTMNCPFGVDKAMLIRAGRSMLSSFNYVPPGLQATVDIHLQTGNNMGVSAQDLKETIEWVEEDLQEELGDPDFKIPLDKEGAKYFLTLNPREPKYYPLTIQAMSRIMYAAKEDFTISTRYWDATNYALFNGDDVATKKLASMVVEEAERLGAEYLVSTECGHGFRVIRWEAQNWLGRPLEFKVKAFVELMAEFIRDGQIKLDPSVNKDPVTYHDPCNQARSGGVVEEPRYILSKAVMDFREMTPNREKNFCCGGGGGALTMTEFAPRRLDAGIVKADQIKATGAKLVATSCHNCIDQLNELSRHYDLGVKALNLCELVSEALVFDK
jgi:Fe-S oxidoreductase